MHWFGFSWKFLCPIKSAANFLFGKLKETKRYLGENSFLAKFCEETNLHGFNHVANRNNTAFERIGWLALILLFTYFALSICIDQVARFITDPFVFTEEIDYNNWAYSIPAHTVCTDYSNDSFIRESYRRTENVTSIDYNSSAYRDYSHYMGIIGQLNAETMHLIDEFENIELFSNLTGEEILDIAVNLKSLNNTDYDWLRPIVTEAGICFSTTKLFKYFKAIQNDFDADSGEYARRVRRLCRSTQTCKWRAEFSHPATKAMIYFHGLNDTLNMIRSPQSEWKPVTGEVDFDIDINEVVTSGRANMFGFAIRKCRFDAETTSNRSYPLGSYTQNLCLMECSVDAAILLCGCRPFFYKIGPGPVCNISGMICLSKFRWNDYRHNCSCLPQCHSIDYSFTRTFSPVDETRIYLRPRVTEARIKRDIKYGVHYLIVSIGGAAALFLGCSFISIIESIYLATKHLYKEYCDKGDLHEPIVWLINTKHPIVVSSKVDSSKRFHYLINNSPLHGVRYLDRRFGIFDRIFWICILIASLIAMVMVFAYTFKDFLDDPIVINADTIISKENRVFPAVSVCIEKANNNRASTTRVENLVKKYYAEHNIEEPQQKDFYDQLMTYAYAYHMPGRGEIFEELDACDAINSTCGVDIETIKQLLFPDCSELINNIQFNGKGFDNCSELFKREIIYNEGVCFMVNSVHFYHLDWDKLPLTYNKYEDGRQFIFDIIQKKGYFFYIYFHSPDELPSVFNGWFFTLYDDMDQEYILRTTQVENDVNVRDLSFEERQCRYSGERWPLNASLPYGFVSCMIYTRVQIELELCNCTPHFAPIEYKDRYCNYGQMKCIADHGTKTLALETQQNIKSCLSSCTEMHVGFVGLYKKEKAIGYKSVSENDTTSGITTVTIDVNSQPRQLTRSVRFTKLDLVVTIGSIIGLFFGASLLSLVDIVYVLLVHRC